MMMPRVHAGNRDRGFTLPEVMISMVVMSTIAAVMVAVVAVVYRTSPTTEARAEDARSVLGLVTWLPQDVDSTPSTGFDTNPARPSGCGIDDGTNLLHLTWTEKIGTTTTTYMSSYRHVTAGTNGRVVRISCSGTGSPPYTGTKVNLTSELPPLPGGWTPGNLPARVTIDTDPITGKVDLVTFELETIDGDIVKTDSASKNPAETLPTTTLPSWMPPPPTTVVKVNNQPVVHPIAVTAHPAVVRTVNLAGLISDADGDTLVLSRVPASEPTGWVVGLSSTTMTITPLATDLGKTFTINYHVDDLQGGGPVTGSVTVTVVPLTSPTSTSTTTSTTSTTAPTTTTTLPPCAVTSVSLSPSSVRNVPADGGNGNVNVGVLKDPVTVNATTNGSCIGLEIRYKSGGVNTPPFIGMTQTGPTTFRHTLPSKNEGASETWSDGAKTISFHSPSGGPHATATLTVL